MEETILTNEQVDAYIQHSQSWVSQEEAERRESNILAFRTIQNQKKRGNPHAKRIVEGWLSGLNATPYDLKRVGLLNEELTSGDLANVTSELMNRRLLAQFASRNDWGWRSYMPVRSPVPDFRTVRPIQLDRNATTADAHVAVAESAPLTSSSFVDSGHDYNMNKYGRSYRHSWELMVNDDQGAVARMPQLINQVAIDTHGRWLTSLHTDASGPSAALYTGAGFSNNIVTGNPDLSESALQAAFAQLGDRDDPTSDSPIMIDAPVLVVGSKALEQIANQILKTIFVDRVDGTNVVRSASTVPVFTVVYNPYIRKIATTANATTSWWLFPNATAAASRPWAEMAFLQGFETPRLFKKMGNVADLAGNPLPNMGSFATMSHETSVLWVYGGTTIEPIVTVASNGTNVP